MSIYSWVELSIFLLVFIYFGIRGRLKKNVTRILVFGGLLAVFGGSIIPLRFFGFWNVAKGFEGKEIERVYLKPSARGWPINLTREDFEIVDQGQIDSLEWFLRHVHPVEPNHPIIIWETDLVLLTRDDSLVFHVRKNEPWQGTIIIRDGDANRYMQEGLGRFLEKITDFKVPFN